MGKHANRSKPTHEHKTEAFSTAKSSKNIVPASGSPSTVSRRRVLIEIDCINRQLLLVNFCSLLYGFSCMRGVRTVKAHFNSYLYSLYLLEEDESKASRLLLGVKIAHFSSALCYHRSTTSP